MQSRYERLKVIATDELQQDLLSPRLLIKMILEIRKEAKDYYTFYNMAFSGLVLPARHSHSSNIETGFFAISKRAIQISDQLMSAQTHLINVDPEGITMTVYILVLFIYFDSYFDMMELAAIQFYSLVMSDVEQLCANPPRACKHDDVELNMLCLAFRLSKLDKDWAKFIPFR